MKFKVEIDCDNDAFAGNPDPEIARILREIARQLDNAETPLRPHDINGNVVGDVWMEPDSRR